MSGVMRPSLVRTAAISLLLLPLSAWPGALQVGGTLPALTLRDQHGESRAIDAGLKAILFSRDMDAGGIVKDALKEGGAELLAGAGAVYVADVSAMPRLIRRIFAIPSMRRRGYPMLLDMEGSATVDFPGGKGQPALITLDELRVTAIESFESAQALRAALSRE
jgi:hypothetical protein